MVAELPDQELEIVEVLDAGLEQHIGEIALDHRLDGDRHGDFAADMDEDEVEVPRAMAQERGHERGVAGLGSRRKRQLKETRLVFLEGLPE